MRSSSQAKSADNMLCVVSLPRTSLLIRGGGGGGGDTVLLVLIKKNDINCKRQWLDPEIY
jgi:hypothetical protein